MPNSASIAGASGGYHKSVRAIVKVEESEIGYRHRHRLHSLEDALGRRDHFGNGYTFVKKIVSRKNLFQVRKVSASDRLYPENSWGMPPPLAFIQENPPVIPR
jgi:hypothetical protein